MELLEDPMMLFSFINTKLRDQYASLDELCRDMDIKRIRWSVNYEWPASNIIRSIISFGRKKLLSKCKYHFFYLLDPFSLLPTLTPPFLLRVESKYPPINKCIPPKGIIRMII